MYVALFDIDSTLLRTQGAGRAAFAETFRAEFDIERIRGDISFAGRSDRAIVREVFTQHGIEDRPGTWQRFRRRLSAAARTELSSPAAEVCFRVCCRCCVRSGSGATSRWAF